MIRFKLCLFFATICLFFNTGFCDTKYEVKIYKDTGAAGWAYMDSCTAFRVDIDSTCYVQWNVTKYKQDEQNPSSGLHLSERNYNTRLFKRCSYSFSDLKEIHTAILDTIVKIWGITRLTKLNWGSFRQGDDWSWNVKVARSSAQSKKYADYRKNYPNTPYNINELFVVLANESKAYEDLNSIFSRYGASIKLHSVEKVFTNKIKKLKCRDLLKKQGLKDENRVMYDVGMSYFTVIATKSKM